MGQLRLDVKAGWQVGGESGSPAVIPGKPDESPLILAVRHVDNQSAMPPNKPRLSDKILADLTEWVRRGAADPRDSSASLDKDASWQAEFQRRLDWWSLRPVSVVTPPECDSQWPLNTVDSFVLHQLHQQHLKPAVDADALTLLRRLCFVLTGLPPTPELMQTFPEQFEQDAQGALEALVDQLIQSPHYGETIARHWMDVVRYTDTYGYEWDNPAKGSWEYRDYLIRAFNNDVGFDQLIREQIAGDLLSSPRLDRVSGLNESLIGPMFYHMGEHRHGDNEVINGVREEMIDNKIDAFSKAFLAMTMACARCHDHKLDAISQKDYYGLAGIFMTARWTSRSIESPQKNAHNIAELQRLRKEIHQRTAAVWLDKGKALLEGKVLREVLSKLDREKLANAKVGEMEWLLNPWLPLSVTSGEAAAAARDVPATWQELKKQWQSTHDQRVAANARFKFVVDFSQESLPGGFVIDGDGMRTGFVMSGQPLIALTGDRAVEQLLAAGYHTHALSSKLPGALRLPRQEDLPGNFISVALAGDEWSGFVRVSDNAIQTENVTFLKRKQAAWQAIGDTPGANGIQRVAYEFATSDLNPNFPPRTGLARVGDVTLPPQDDGFDKRSWFSITGIVSHNEAGQPQDDLSHFESLFTDQPPTNEAEALIRIGAWLNTSVNRYESGQCNAGDVQLLNWMLDQGLLSNRLDDDEQLSRLVHEYRATESLLPVARTCNSMDERLVKPINYALNVRGDINRRADLVPRCLPSFTCELNSNSKSNLSETEHSGRLELAEFLTDPGHGLTARVYVNRIWQWVFGEGLVRTPNDFGHLGEQPSHPELLDHLAREFIADSWSTKRLIRRLVLSHTFRQSSQVTPTANADPTNRWLHHYPTRRLEAESIRDALLAVSGRLDRSLYGRPINPPRLVEDPSKRLYSGPLDGHGRRSIYLEVSIMDRSKFLQTFNAPDPKLPTARRDETNAPAQALAMLNDPLVLTMAGEWSSKLVSDGSSSIEDRIETMFVQAVGRHPSPPEISRWVSLVRSLSSTQDVLGDHQAWKHAAHTMFNLQEFTHFR